MAPYPGGAQIDGSSADFVVGGVYLAVGVALMADPIKIEHGGNLQAASARYGIAVQDWLDLSTGINPNGYPVPPIPPAAWHDLPYMADALVQTARAAYAVPATFTLTPTAGSQPVIMALPRLLPDYPVLLPQWGYADHRHAWQASGRRCQFYPSLSAAEQTATIEAALADNPQQHLVLIQPNNPTGVLLPAEQLRRWAAQLGHGARLIVDETFIDATPEQSVCPTQLHPAMIVLRSVGKFFGLAGMRLGCVLAESNWSQLLQAELGPWSVSGPAQVVGQQALADVAWQTHMRAELKQSQQLHAQWLAPLASLAQRPSQHLPLFSTFWLPATVAQRFCDVAGQQGLLLRSLPSAAGLEMVRIGRLRLTDSAGQQRLQQLVQRFMQIQLV